MPNPAQEDLNEYDKLKTKLNDYFTPRKINTHARYLFSRMRPVAGESAAYAGETQEKQQRTQPS